MDTATTTKTISSGGEWLIRTSHPQETFIPEDFTEEQRMIMDACSQFLNNEILPVIDRIDQLEPGLMQSLLEKAGQQGLLGISIPEAYGGLGKDFVTSMIVAEGLGGGYSFSVASAAHTGIGTLPILYFGTAAQQERYIPKLASGEWKAAYGLTEPGSGSDALSVKTTAQLSEDGTCYHINGQKCWITNGGFADTYIVFAKIGNEPALGPKPAFTAFIVEKGMEGFTQGAEEHKMGIKGSSTVQLYFQDCKVPVANVLGQKGKGHVIAFNILNLGRIKLAAAAMGGAKRIATLAIQYANIREQFRQPISRFGAMQHKLAQMAVKIWATETAVYRASKYIDEKEAELLEQGRPFSEALLGAAEEFAIECAMLKVHGSETLDYVVDEAVQIHGGNGFSEEYLVSKAYRDSRINRIFEGTNEINRLLTVDMVLKRAMNGRLNLMGPAMNIQKELMAIPDFGSEEAGFLDAEQQAVANMKKAILMVDGAAVQKWMMKIEGEQELLMNMADMAIETFVAESCLLRVLRLVTHRGVEGVTDETDLFRIYLHEAVGKLEHCGKEAINAFAEGDEQRMLLLGLKRFTKLAPFNTKEARRRLAARLIEANQFCF